MKEIDDVLSEMLESGKTKNMSKINSISKMSNLEVQAILFAIFTRSKLAIYKALVICDYVGQALEEIEDEKNNLFPLNVVLSVINSVLLNLTKDINCSKFFTSLFVLSYFDMDRAKALEVYIINKFIVSMR